MPVLTVEFTLDFGLPHHLNEDEVSDLVEAVVDCLMSQRVIDPSAGTSHRGTDLIMHIEMSFQGVNHYAVARKSFPMVEKAVNVAVMTVEGLVVRRQELQYQ
jgi:hypothetical protein